MARIGTLNPALNQMKEKREPPLSR